MASTRAAVTRGIFLLAHDVQGKPWMTGQNTDSALVGALLTDPVLAGRVRVDDDKYVQLLEPSPTGDLLLDEGLSRLLPLQGRPVATVVEKGGSRLEGAIGDHLAALGGVDVVEGSRMGLRPRSHPVRDTSDVAGLHAWLVRGLQGDQPTVVEHALLGLVHALCIGDRVFVEQQTGLTRKEFSRRLRGIAQSAGPGVDGAEEVIEQMNALLVVTAIMPMMIASM